MQIDNIDFLTITVRCSTAFNHRPFDLLVHLREIQHYWHFREVVITSVLDEDPPCLVVGCYTRHHVTGERHGHNLLTLKFEMSN